MKKWLRNKQCAYCGVNPATTEDHVFAVGFFHHADRDNSLLPKAPACSECNGKKSKLDEYAISVLTFGGRHPSAVANAEGKGVRRMRQNSALLERVRRGAGRAWTESPSGLIIPTITFPVEAKQLVSLFEYIAKGLMWHHWRVYVKGDTKIDVAFLTQESDRQTREQFAQWPSMVVQADLRNATVLYEGVHGEQIPQFSAWRIAIYGGVQFASHDAAGGVCTTIRIITSRSDEAGSQAAPP
jgi:hypothetical protein